MHKQRIYIDTSVLGGYYDSEFEEYSKKLIDEFIIGKKIVVISDVTIEELEDAPKRVRKIISLIPENNKIIVALSQEARELSYHYITEGIVNNKSLLDTRHIAIATVNNVDVLASWNFKHIVNYNKIKQYNSVNLKMGYSLIDIRSPQELIDEN